MILSMSNHVFALFVLSVLLLLQGCSLFDQNDAVAGIESSTEATDTNVKENIGENYIMDKTLSEFDVNQIECITVGLIDVDIDIEQQYILSADDAIEYGQKIFDKYRVVSQTCDEWVMMGISYDEENGAWLTWFSEPPLRPGECISIVFFDDGEIVAIYAGE